MKPQILNIPLAEYLADPAPEPSLSRSDMVTLLNRSPFAAWFEHPRMNPERQGDDATRAMDTGSAAHALLLEGRDAFEVIDARDYRTKAAQESRDAARERGKIPILTSAHQDVLGMVSAAKSKLIEAGFDLSAGDSELSLVWHSGCWLRTRPDWISKDRRRIIEYKTTQSTPADWMRGMHGHGYDIQAAMHRAGAAACFGVDAEVTFAVQSTLAPYSMFFATLSPLYYDVAEKKIGRAVDIWTRCIDADHWPDYGATPHVVDPSNWQLAQEEERAFAHEGWTVEAFLAGRVKETKK